MEKLNRTHDSSTAILLGMASSTAYAAAYVLVRLLGKGHLHAFEIVFFRTVACFLAILAISKLVGRGGFKTQRRRLILARGLLSAVGLLLWFYGLVRLPIAEAITLSLTTVCFASIGAAIFLGEPITRKKGCAIVLALGGAVVIVQPGFGAFKPEYLVVLGSAACWGAAACLVRSTSRTEDPYTIVLWTTLVIAVFSFPTAVAVWQWPSFLEIVILTAIGLLSALGMVLWTSAFRYGEATLVTITDFIQITWGVLIGSMFGEFPSHMSLIGIALIVCSVVVMTVGSS